ncbi:hypothetical protein [Photobacterium damselae]|uniref:hypothetical protein n=1 Tax=Photobacterium damselae TaxID=38293 RepID=UPI000A300D1A|nr:hypothetical protein [Photobacterium damselae]ARR51909.1 hypothetical protein CAY62_21130 [Photobacterium damselae subsp. damselae]
MNKLILSIYLIFGCIGLTACNDSDNSKTNTKKLTSDEVQKVIIVDDPEQKELLEKRMKDRMKDNF